MSNKVESTKKALERYFDKQAKKNNPLRKKRKNAKPEKLVEKEVMHWLNSNDFSCHIVESKAVFNQRAGIYLHSQAEPGMSDIVGCMPNGIGCFIELKAFGKRSSLKEHQRAFLIDKIECGAFAACVDSVDYLNECLDHFKKGGDLRLKLPKKRSRKQKDIDFI